MRAVETQWWILDLPDEWEAEQDDDSVIVHDADGVGEIIITTLEKEAGEVNDEDLQALWSDAEPAIAPNAITVADLTGFYCSYCDDGEAIRDWYLRAGRLLIVITYICDQDNAGMDDAAVDEILDTLFLLPAAEAQA